MQKSETKKRVASFVLYVFSIALAVGIGAWQVGAGKQASVHNAAMNDDCRYLYYNTFTCSSAEDATCTQGSYRSGFSSGDVVQAIYYPQCVDRYGDKPGEFIDDPSCYSNSYRATTDGCSEE